MNEWGRVFVWGGGIAVFVFLGVLTSLIVSMQLDFDIDPYGKISPVKLFGNLFLFCWGAFVGFNHKKDNGFLREYTPIKYPVSTFLVFAILISMTSHSAYWILKTFKETSIPFLVGFFGTILLRFTFLKLFQQHDRYR